MRLLVLTHNYPRFPGDPAGAYVARLARATADSSSQVQVIAPHVSGTSEREQERGLDLRRFRYAPTSLERVGYRGASDSVLQPLTLALAPLYLSAFRRSARRAVAELRPSVIHAHWWFPGGWVASSLGLPYVVTSHGSDVRLFDRGGWWRRIGRDVLARAAAVTTASRFLAGDLERHAGPLARPITVTPMPLDVERFEAGQATPKAVPPRILFAGNLVASKGVDVLVRALAILKARDVPFRARILGEGPERGGLERLAAAVGVGADVEWSPFLPQDRMPAEYGASTVAVLPSRGQAEGLGLTLVEALLAGCSVVGTPAGGIPEVVHDGVTGLIAKDGDAADLAQQLIRLLLDPKLRERLTQTGRTMALATYATEPAARRFLDLYDAVARDHQTH
jgi:glycosyltransferase involved in cell wall biosynthesis